ncbi:hypothetical protein ACIA5G_39480 [Amycolatopsis sp. NPDC051758]|uniref:hypothetical protein n=1 Tax=Amycolatopsis sp. NPDC051758 TaxID=3363935 RepID=UPI0037AC0DAF
MSGTAPKPDSGEKPNLAGAKAFAAFSGDDRWYILADGETVRYQRADGTFVPEYDEKGARRLTILTASVLRRGTETWHEVPLDE